MTAALAYQTAQRPSDGLKQRASLAAAYLRVSTARQGLSGLGLDAQQAAVLHHLGGDQPTRTFLEIETGTCKRTRPVLDEALAYCRLTGAELVVAKVDRLTRSVAFLSRLLESGVTVRFCDLPELEGPQGRFLLNQMAAVAELEAGLIAQRTRAALAAAKARGTKLGNPNGCAAIRRAGKGNVAACATVQANADCRAQSLATIVRELCPGRSLRQLAEEMNERHIRTPRGGSWHAASVSRLIQRLGQSAGAQ